MRQQNRKGNFNKHTNNAYGYGNQMNTSIANYKKTCSMLLEWLMEKHGDLARLR